VRDENLLVGTSTADDAGVYKISETEALIMTVDFFPPIVDDPYTFGRIAAANALSDVYAMGGTPLIGLNIVCFPHKEMPLSLLSAVLKGGQDKMQEAGALIIGGHTVKDPELKYGIALTGMILIKNIKTNAGAQPGDQVILTKPLGTGIISTALKSNKANPQDVEFIMKQMAELNKIPSEIMVKYGANAATDITGFALIGHSQEVAENSGVTIRINSRTVPLIPNALDYSRGGFIPGGLNDNRNNYQPNVKYEREISPELENLLYDPQTSGGLLIFAPPEKAALMLAEIKAAGIEQASIIGEVILQREKLIEIY
jgi:selenide,water dikinase